MIVDSIRALRPGWDRPALERQDPNTTGRRGGATLKLKSLIYCHD